MEELRNNSKKSMKHTVNEQLNGGNKSFFISTLNINRLNSLKGKDWQNKKK